MSKSKNIKTKLGCIFLVIFMTILGFYLFIGLKFGEVVVEGTTEIKKIEKDLKSKKINPVDTIKQEVINIIDSAKVE